MAKRKSAKSKLLFLAGVCVVYNLYSDIETPTLRRDLAIKDQQHSLEFVHIPRNGGRAVEQAACANGVHWGSMKHHPHDHMSNCDYDDHQANEHNEAGESPYKEIDKWQTPPARRLHHDHHMSKKDLPRPFHKGAKLFAVVRNPYERLVQDFYDPIIGFKGSAEEKQDKNVLNYWICERLGNHETKEVSRRELNDEEDSSKHEYISQVEYVYDNSDGSKVVDVVLHFEDLKREFDDLMKMYGLNFTLPDKEVIQHDERVHEQDLFLTYKDLNNTTLNEINTVAGPDFVAFGYTKIELYQVEEEVQDRTQLKDARSLFLALDDYSASHSVGTCLVYNPSVSASCDRD